INIAGRIYPLEISTDDEEVVRAAGKLVNDKLQSYAEQFSLRDYQDGLAMFAIEIATQYEKLIVQMQHTDKQIDTQLAQLNELLKDVQTS
ncbi:MAG: cell division protein ZapA, partial [Bacteroidetes bacterium]|nr:cell division protein ZapA [Bacteroidota bacterium]